MLGGHFHAGNKSSPDWHLPRVLQQVFLQDLYLGAFILPSTFTGLPEPPATFPDSFVVVF